MSNGQAVFEPTAFAMPSDSKFHVRSTEETEEVHPMAQLLDEMDATMSLPNSGEVRTGIIVDKRSSELLVDIRYKSEGFVSSRELDRLGDLLDTLEIGDEVPVYIMREDRDGNLQLSISRALAEKDWETAEELMASQDIFEGEVAAYNRGGVIVKLGQVRGFVPASQLSTTSQALTRNSNADAEAAPEDRWARLMGTETQTEGHRYRSQPQSSDPLRATGHA